jgi:hypothetical protein
VIISCGASGIASKRSEVYKRSNTQVCVFFSSSLGGQTNILETQKKVEVPMMQRTFFEAKNGQQVGLVVVTL